MIDLLTLHFIPYSEIEDLGSARRVKKILDAVKENKIVLLEGRLKKEEETDLIAITMEEITAKFKGIEIATIDPEKKDVTLGKKIKHGFTNMLLGDRKGFTIIGPAAVDKKIKQDPDKIELFTKETRKKK